MLISQSIFSMLFTIKHTDLQLYYNAISGFDMSNFIKCGSYSRYLISFENGTVKTHSITVYRVIRKGAMSRHTHAILPDIIVPYSSYSIRFIIYILYLYTHRNCSAEDFCKKYFISRSTIHEWLKLYSSHIQEWINLLKSSDNAFGDSIAYSLSDFLYQYMHTTKHPFLVRRICHYTLSIPP